MKKKWKKLMAVWCAAVMLMTMPGVGVLADEMREKDELIVEEAEVSKEPVESVNAPIESVTESVDAPIKEDASSPEAAEEVVGEGTIQVGDGVTATFDVDTGAVEFISQDGELWPDWVDKLGVGRDEIKSIKVASGTVYLPADSRGYDTWKGSSYIFGSLYNLTSLDLSNFDTSNVTDMGFMFEWCESLRSLDLSSFDTSNVTNMSYMFRGCSSLSSLDLSSFNTSNVINMNSMFSMSFGCNLTNLDLSSFDTSNVTDMKFMFTNCNKLTNLDLSNFDTSNVMDMKNMFEGCTSLTNLDLRSFNTLNVTDMGDMFYDCRSLTKLDLRNFNTSNVTDMGGLFDGCQRLTKLDLGSFDTSNVTNMGGMFSLCYSLKSLDLSHFDTSNVTSMRYMFDSCSSLTNLDLGSFDTSNVTDMSAMFCWCHDLTSLDLSSFDTSNVRDINGLIYDCSALQVLKTPKKNVISVDLPAIMYDSAGNEYERIPILSESIVLTRNNPTTNTDISDCEIFLSATSFIYDGKAKEPDVTVKSGSTVLKSGIDYTVSYANNTNIGTATVKVTGIGNYSGEEYVTFMIEGVNWVDNTNFPHYYTIALQAASTGRFVTCDVGAKDDQGRYSKMNHPDLNADATKIMAYEEFELVPCPDGSYALRSVMNRKFLSVYIDPKTYLVNFGFDQSFIGDNEKFILKMGSSGVIKSKKYNLWLSVHEGKLRITSDKNEAEVFNQILIDNNSYTTDEFAILAKDEWFNLNDQGEGGYYNIQDDVGKNTANNAKTLENLGYTIMNEAGQFGRDYIQLDYMQCFVAYKKINGRYEVIIAFQGTGGYGVDDWFSDVGPNMAGNGETNSLGQHVGYTEMARKLSRKEKDISNYSNTVKLSELITKAREDGTVHFTILGHSMGGAIAQCYALHLANEKAIPKYQISGRTFNSALAVDKDDTDFKDWYNICVSSDTVCNGLVLGSIIDYGIHRLGKTIWLYDMQPDKGTDHFPVADIATDKHNMDKCLYYLLYDIWNEKKCDHAWDEGTVEEFTYVLDDQVQFERIFTCSKCTQTKNIEVTPLSNDIEVSGLQSKVYTGKAITQTLVLKNGVVKLKEGTDYVVSYKDNINVGTATVTIIGKGNYYGTIIRTFKINKADAELVFDESAVTKKTTDVAFTNALTKKTDGTVTFKSSNTNVATVNSTSGFVKIKGAGTTTITVAASEGKNYKAGSASYTLTVKEASTITSGFSDVQDSTHPYYNAIYWAADAGITGGYKDGTFGIDKPCTRGHAVMFLWKMKGKPEPNSVSKTPFPDVPKTHPYYKAVLWAQQNGITKGYTSGVNKGKFGIDDTCTRGQIMTFIWNFKDKPAPKSVSKSPFSDVPTTHPYYKAILWGSQNGVTKGYTTGPNAGKFGINDNCTRGQIVKFLYNIR